MKISLSTASVTRVKTDLLVVGVSSTDVASTPVLSELDAALGPIVRALRDLPGSPRSE